MKISLQLVGTRPLIVHNGRLANPIDPHTRALKALTKKRNKTDEDLIAIMRTEARGAIYETADGYVGFPTPNVWRCLYDAAKAYKRGADLQRAMVPEPNVEPVYVDGENPTVDDYLSDPTHIDYRPVRVQRNTTMRARPIYPNWITTHHFELLEDVIDPRDLAPILERAGRLVGVGDNRPMYGAFQATVL